MKRENPGIGLQPISCAQKKRLTEQHYRTGIGVDTNPKHARGVRVRLPCVELALFAI